jgi:hypothetical protein
VTRLFCVITDHRLYNCTCKSLRYKEGWAGKYYFEGYQDHNCARWPPRTDLLDIFNVTRPSNCLYYITSTWARHLSCNLRCDQKYSFFPNGHWPQLADSDLHQSQLLFYFTMAASVVLSMLNMPPPSDLVNYSNSNIVRKSVLPKWNPRMPRTRWLHAYPARLTCNSCFCRCMQRGLYPWSTKHVIANEVKAPVQCQGLKQALHR